MRKGMCILALLSLTFPFMKALNAPECGHDFHFLFTRVPRTRTARYRVLLVSSQPMYRYRGCDLVKSMVRNAI